MNTQKGGDMLTAGTMINGGFALVRERIAAIGLWSLIYFALNVGLVFAMRPFMLGLMQIQAQTAAGLPPSTAFPPGLGQFFLAYPALLVVIVVLFTAALRAKFNPQDSAFAYLRLGGDELRIVGVAAALLLAFMVLYFALALVVVLAGVLLAMLSQALIVPIVIVGILVVVGVLVFFQVRFSLAFALTLLRGKMVIGESWRLTRGHFWTLFGGYLVIGLIMVAVSVAVAFVTQGEYMMEVMRAGTDPVARAAAQQHQMQRQFVDITPLTMFGWVLSSVVGAAWLALGAGAVGSATLALLDEEYGEVGMGHTESER